MSQSELFTMAREALDRLKRIHSNSESGVLILTSS
jgi:hypothetical protein